MKKKKNIEAQAGPIVRSNIQQSSPGWDRPLSNRGYGDLAWVQKARHLWVNMPLWTLVFWGWVILVSLWIDNAPAEQLKIADTKQKLINIEFSGMRFEQKYADGMQLIVEAPFAKIDEESNLLLLENPVLTQTFGDEKTYTASGDHGTVDLKLDQSSLPSSFEQLILTGSARAESGATSVFTSEMIFDCRSQLFYCPQRYKFDLNGAFIQGENMMYDPHTKKMQSLR